VWLTLGAWVPYVSGQAVVNIHQATLMEPDQKTPELSTHELRQLLAEQSATVFDARPFAEYSVSHIPGAVTVPAKPGLSASLYVADITAISRVVQGNKAAPIGLYCNGPFCDKSKRLAEELLTAGYTNVRRYQLGIPVWRALGGITEIEAEGVHGVLEKDQTAVWIDAREPEEFQASSLPQARNLPRSRVQPGKNVGEIKQAKDDGRLPMDDHNTRIIVFGRDGAQGKAVAEAIAQEAFHNVAYFARPLERLRTAAVR